MNEPAETKLGFPWAAVLVAPLIVLMASAVVAHALKEFWWPWCRPDQIVIGGEMVNHFAKVEQKKGVNDVLEFTLFHTVRISGGVNWEEVTTGIKWASSKDRAPVRQYCYFALRTDGVQRVIDLADRDGLGAIRFKQVDENSAKAAGRTAAEMQELARTACRWMKEGA
jgi:hypothetical protein